MRHADLQAERALVVLTGQLHDLDLVVEVDPSVFVDRGLPLALLPTLDHRHGRLVVMEDEPRLCVLSK